MVKMLRFPELQSLLWVSREILSLLGLRPVLSGLDVFGRFQVPVSATDAEDQKFRLALEHEIDIVKGINCQSRTVRWSTKKKRSRMGFRANFP
eukprot:92362-Amphidinium_carterae.1